jgi:hypothetical protein
MGFKHFDQDFSSVTYWALLILGLTDLIVTRDVLQSVKKIIDLPSVPIFIYAFN